MQGDVEHAALAAYREAERQLAAADAEVTRSADRRAAAVAALSGDGWSYARIAAQLRVSRARVQQLVERGRQVAHTAEPPRHTARGDESDATQRRLGSELYPAMRNPQECETAPHDALAGDIGERGFINAAVGVPQEESVHAADLSTSGAPRGCEAPESDPVDGMTVTRHLSDTELQKNLPLDLELLREVLRSNRVGRAWLFGSRSRGDHRPDSDIDVLYEPEGDRLQLREYGRLVNALQDVCPVPVDLADAIMDRMKSHVEDDLVRVL